MSNSDKLAIALACLTSIPSLLLFWMDRTPTAAVIMPLLIALLAVYPIIHFVHGGVLKKASLLAVLVGTALAFGIWHKRKATPTALHPQLPFVDTTALENTPAAQAQKEKQPPRSPDSGGGARTSSSNLRQEQVTSRPMRAAKMAEQGEVKISAVPMYNPLRDPVFVEELNALDKEYERSHAGHLSSPEFDSQKNVWVFEEINRRDPRFTYALQYGKRYEPPHNAPGDLVTTGPESIVRGNEIHSSSNDCGVFQYGENSTAIGNKITCNPKQGVPEPKPQ